MRFVVEYQGKRGRMGLIIFSATDQHSAQIYVEELVTCHGHTSISNLNELKDGTVAELFRLYPRIASVTKRNSVTARGQG